VLLQGNMADDYTSSEYFLSKSLLGASQIRGVRWSLFNVCVSRSSYLNVLSKRLFQYLFSTVMMAIQIFEKLLDTGNNDAHHLISHQKYQGIKS
jgi:hypothetical protein